MRRNPQIIAGWSSISSLLSASAICTETSCKTTIPWTLGIKEFAVFSVDNGVATPIGETKYIYK